MRPEGTDGANDVGEREGIGVVVRSFEELLILGNAPEPLEQLLLHSVQSELHGFGPEHRDERLILEVEQQGIRPAKRRSVGDVGEGHRVTGMSFSGRARRSRRAVGERELLLVARRTGLRAVAREARVVKQVPAELDLLVGHAIVRRHDRRGKPGWQVPHEAAGRRPSGGVAAGLAAGCIAAGSIAAAAARVAALACARRLAAFASVYAAGCRASCSSVATRSSNRASPVAFSCAAAASLVTARLTSTAPSQRRAMPRRQRTYVQ